MMTNDFDINWWNSAVNSLTQKYIIISPSEFAEANRHLSQAEAAIPGPYSYDVTPYLREIIDNFDPRSPIQEVIVQKAAQIGFTSGVLENTILYGIGEIVNVPILYATIDNDMAKMRLDSNIIPALRQAGLSTVLKAHDTESRKSGKSSNRLEWPGGTLHALGTVTHNKLKSTAAKWGLFDEVDAMKQNIKGQGDPLDLLRSRLRGFSDTRKMLIGSTPTEVQTSRIVVQYERGDQRKYFVPCPYCGEYQVLRFSGKNKENDREYGLKYEYDEKGVPNLETVRYVCMHCGKGIKSHQKKDMLAKGQWKPTAKAIRNNIRSYHVSALYAPNGFYSWEDMVSDFTESFDVINKNVRNINKFKNFYNDSLGDAFENRSSKIRFKALHEHKRPYNSNQIPNIYAEQFSHSGILFLLATIDVQQWGLSAALWGVCDKGILYLIDRVEFYYNKKIENAKGVTLDAWGQLHEWLKGKWVSDNGVTYKIKGALMDSRHFPEKVFPFVNRCRNSKINIYPCQGVDTRANIKNYRIVELPSVSVVSINVHYYKDLYAEVLRRQWHQITPQTDNHFNCPSDISDNVLKELSAEHRVMYEKGGKNGETDYIWEKTSPGVANELWDQLVYCGCLIDVIVSTVCKNRFDLDKANPELFWKHEVKKYKKKTLTS